MHACILLSGICRNILIFAGTHACSLGVAVATSGDSCAPWCASREGVFACQERARRSTRGWAAYYSTLRDRNRYGTMVTIDLEYDEARGNPATPECLSSLEINEELYLATRRVLPYEVAADAAPNYRVVPVAFFENVVRKAPVPDPASLRPVHFLTRSMDLYSSVKPMIELLVEEGLIHDDNGDLVIYDDITKFYARADELVEAMKDHPTMQVDNTCWEFMDANTHASLAWIDTGLSLERLTIQTGDLSLYCDLNMIVGPRAVDATRVNVGSQLHEVACDTGLGGGMLRAAVTRHQMGKDATLLTSQYASHILPSFLRDSRWESPYNVEYGTLIDYSFEVPRRAEWATASEAAWPMLVMHKVVRAVGQLQPLSHLLWSHMDHAQQMMADVNRLGFALLSGDAGGKHPLKRVDELNRLLRRDHASYIYEHHSASTSTTDMIDVLIERRPTGEGEIVGAGANESGASADGSSEAHVGAKRAQVKRALGQASYVKLESKWLPVLRDATGKDKDNLAMLDECFQAETLLPKAVLLATPGVKLAPYYADSDWLDLLKDEVDSMSYYLGQCVAYDEDDEEVPEGLETYQLGKEQMALVRGLQWAAIDPLSIVLAVKSKQTTAHFPNHDARKLYHVAHGIQLAYEVMSQLYRGLGFKDEVPAAQGWSYPAFIRQVKKMNKASIGMDSGQAARMHSFVDRCVSEATAAAALSYRRVVFGASPADKSVGAWLGASHPIYLEMQAALEGLKKVHLFRLALPGVFGGGVTAQAIPGLAAGGPSGSGTPSDTTDLDDGADKKSKRQKKRDAREAREAAEAAAAAPETAARAGALKTGGGTMAGMSKSQRLAMNPKKVFYYDDEMHSQGEWLINWPDICGKYGWKVEAHCGPVTMNVNQSKPRDFNCMDPGHK